MDNVSPATLTAPPVVLRRRLRVRGTSITLLDPVRMRAAADLGFDVDFELLEFPICQSRAAMDPEGYDVYEQCFHNLDIVWFWGALQPIDISRIRDWGNISALAKEGGVSKYAWRGHGDAPVKKLYVQPGGFLGPKPTRQISMLPTVHNMDSFGFDARVFGTGPDVRPSWSWLLDRRAKGRIALVDEPAIGLFDAALAAEASGELEFADIGNMTIEEINALMALLEDRRAQGYFCGAWRDGEAAANLIRNGSVAVQSMWSPVYGKLGAGFGHFVESAPIEGYRAWHGGASLSRHLRGAGLDMAYEYLNWWLSGFAGAVMARQGYYISNPEPIKAHLTPEEWAYWYDGAAARHDLAGPDGDTVVKAGARRAGGPYHERSRRIAIWNTVMDEYNYATRAWDRFIGRVREGVAA
ncbi:MAG: signal peptide prediction [Pseudotabrizicola sp.]|uniref:ABC transporter substrate-binding protein n=1 Tax=Pseudotabrizicola sp. TaxID=2939647 RepID=UPI0027199169|nr:signal peptide prediction [Pseudotabrizicola sp.]MDO8882109.1 signal peptide prediction [Pseudotabrizicola sp.]MDP2083049.1 signal peptide prediction [Pseudotabrizicola sp.]MDZ7572467.1 signal peptide prediction [Pseudotabrizicola sp.]